jgi:hypothetical protein
VGCSAGGLGGVAGEEWGSNEGGLGRMEKEREGQTVGLFMPDGSAYIASTVATPHCYPLSFVHLYAVVAYLALCWACHQLEHDQNKLDAPIVDYDWSEAFQLYSRLALQPQYAIVSLFPLFRKKWDHRQ